MQCVTVSYGKVRGKAKNYPYVQPALYESAKRLDGIRTWRYVRHLGTARRSSRLAELDAVIVASEMGLPMVSMVRQGTLAIGPEPKPC